MAEIKKTGGRIGVYDENGRLLTSVVDTPATRAYVTEKYDLTGDTADQVIDLAETGTLIERARARRDASETSERSLRARRQKFEDAAEELYIRTLHVSMPDYEGKDSHGKIEEDRDLLQEQYYHEFGDSDYAAISEIFDDRS